MCVCMRAKEGGREQVSVSPVEVFGTCIKLIGFDFCSVSFYLSSH